MCGTRRCGFRADPAFRLESGAPRPYERGYRVGRDAWPDASIFLSQRRAAPELVGRFRMCRVCVGVGDADLACRFESCFQRPYGRGYGVGPLLSKKAPTRSIHLEGTAAKMAARQIYPKARDRPGRRRPAARMAARQGTITAAQDHTDRTPRRCVPTIFG